MSTNFISNIIESDLEEGRRDKLVTRFPPEPNGFLHIGHAKSICLNFGLAQDFKGECNLRFDDTNPAKEEQMYVDSIIEDVSWLGFKWAGEPRFASDYFQQMYEYALHMIRQGLAYVDDQSGDEIRAGRGTLTEAGVDSPWRDRTVDENLDLFQRMNAGEFEEGSRVLRARIDMSSGNINLRDPVMYRILKKPHHRSASRWNVYPMYDWAHGIEDSIEGVTHSVCTLEFEDHRPLYDWYLEQLDVHHPQQIEFARLNLDYTIMSKRTLNTLVSDGHVNGWDDPRLPTIAGLRRRGFTPQSIRDFCERIGVTKKDTTIELGMLENSIREDLDAKAPRRMVVLRPLKLTIRNYPEDKVEYFDAPNHPQNPDMGTRRVSFSRNLLVERDDYMDDPPKKFFRLGPGREVRLRFAYLVTCVDVVRDEKTGEAIELICEYDPQSRGGAAPDGRKVKGTLHWVCADSGIRAAVNLYDRLFNVPNPKSNELEVHLNPESLVAIEDAVVEQSLATTAPAERFQFERLGYFCADTESRTEALIFNRTVTLRDGWAKAKSKGQ